MCRHVCSRYHKHQLDELALHCNLALGQVGRIRMCISCIGDKCRLMKLQSAVSVDSVVIKYDRISVWHTL